MEDWALIRRLHVSEKLPKAEIARQLGISRNTVAKAIASADRPEYSRSSSVTSFVPFEEQVRQLLLATPSMPATVLAERVGWSGSSSWFRQNVAAIRPDYAPADPADRIVYHAGDQVQCDLWFPEPKFPNSVRLKVLLPAGILKTLIMLIVGSCFAELVFSILTDPNSMLRNGFLLMSLPGLVLSLVGLLGHDPTWTWPRQLFGCLILAATVGLVLSGWRVRLPGSA